MWTALKFAASGVGFAGTILLIDIRLVKITLFDPLREDLNQFRMEVRGDFKASQEKLSEVAAAVKVGHVSATSLDS